MIEHMKVPREVRAAFVSDLARLRGDDSWLAWYDKPPLSQEDMRQAVAQWKEKYPMPEDIKTRLSDLKKLKTRESKRDAQQLKRAAFKAYIREEICFDHNIAMQFLKYPESQVFTLSRSRRRNGAVLLAKEDVKNNG